MSRKVAFGVKTLPVKVLRAVVGYFGASFGELKLVTWPTRQAVVSYTILTIVTISVSLAVISGVDYVLRLATEEFLIK